MPLSQFSRLISTGSALPSRCVTNDELARELASLGVETSDEWIRSRTGIETRYLVSGEEGTLSLAVGASRAALESGAIDPETIDLVIVATTTPDEVFPAVACRLQSALGIPPCAAFDIQAVCSGFDYAVSVADSELNPFPVFLTGVTARPACSLGTGREPRCLRRPISLAFS